MWLNRLCLWIIILFSPSVYAQTKRALIIAIDSYPKGSGWEKMHGTNDSKLIEGFLLSVNFKGDNIRKLHNEQATKTNIVNELEKLYRQSLPGDHIHVHFSCHGQQMMDDNGDEEDGLDEALIPYDAQFWYKPGIYEGANHFRDDELGVWIKKLREKAGGRGQVVITIDACHSGTANRVYGERDYIRGTGYIFAPDDFLPEPGKNTELSLRLAQKSNIAPACVLSACLAEEINYEHFCEQKAQYYGRLTYAFVHTLTSLPQGASFEKVYNDMQAYNERLTINPKKKQHFYMETSSPSSTHRYLPAK